MAYEMVAVGDSVTDAFIRLSDARVECDEHGAHCMLCVRYGDKVPFEFAEIVPGVGNAANAAVACARLGLATALRTHVGDDAQGKECVQSFENNGVATELVVAQPGKTTNYHYVLWYESDRTILIKHETFDYQFPAALEAPRWIYLSSLSDHSRAYHDAIADYLEAHPTIQLAFQPGTFQIKLGTEALARIYARTSLFFCNKEEAQTILNTASDDVATLLKGIQALGVQTPIITDGRNGAYGITNGAPWHIPMYPDPAPPKERTGAGDATASTTAAYLAMGMSIEESLMRGMINSANVVQEIGAQKGLLSKDEIEAWYQKRPADFAPHPLAQS